MRMEEFQKKKFQTTFHHHIQARNAKISSIFHFDRVNNGRICHILCVKSRELTFAGILPRCPLMYIQSRPDFGVLIKLFYMQYYTRKFYNQSACHDNNHTQNYAFQPEETNLKPHIVRSSTYGAPNSRKSSTLKSGRKRALAGEGWGPLQGPKVRVHSRFEYFKNSLMSLASHQLIWL